MKTKEIIERVAAGLRKCKRTPDYFLFCDTDSWWVWDKEKILTIPVLHSVFIQNQMAENEVPFIPLWKKVNDYIMVRRRFNEGFLDYNVNG